ncbi:nucleotidyltransferase domain-containing protein [Spirosoma terrae]|uniref:Nucleotidyltransferase domain-containing protein n=1 Tax=Spirosoma terrae TaxID=1968276 RepID=A0A6L9L0D6_9BACT|nr:nucleotidyltransferase domain-containing protein [Spirosoma terrae]NDU93954.1 nucleotidyltransferase domain-containing protein [Spirosoma terrae]
MPYGLIDNDLARIVDVLAMNGRVEQAVLFGSRAKGTHKPGSDVDIALKGADLTLNDLLALSVALDELWIPLRVDLLLYNRIDEPALLDHIDRVGKNLMLR